MTNDCPVMPGTHTSGASRRALPVLLGGLFAIALLAALAAGVAASSLDPASSMQDRLSTGTTLAVVRAGGASLYDEAGQPMLDLPMGTAFKVSGRTADNQWFYGATRGGSIGWVSASEVLIFGVRNVPERTGFDGRVPASAASTAAPVAATLAETDAPASPAQPAADASLRLPASVASGSQRLNVRSGPGTAFAVVTSLAPGTKLTAVARDAGADWIQVEGEALQDRPGWVSARYLDLQGNAQDLPAAATAQPPPSPVPPAAATGLTGKLVFQESSGGAIAVYDLASGSLRALATGADPALSPDGQTVAFWRQDGGEHGLYLIGIDGSGERRILTRAEKLRAPAWSPDGSDIVFSRVDGEHRCRDAGFICLPDVFPYNTMFPLKTTDKWGLARVDGEGGSYQEVAAIADAITPDWSERGILYSALGIQLTQDGPEAGENRQVLGEYRYQDPAAQPGGDRIVFHSLEKDHWEIFSANADGSNLTALTRPETTLVTPLPHNVAPAWSPDGQHIVFLSNRSGEWKLWIMNSDGGGQHALPVDAPIAYTYQAEQVVSWGQ